jgi:hypothetical protein
MRTAANPLPWMKWAGLDPGVVVPALVTAAGYYLAVRFGGAFKLQP